MARVGSSASDVFNMQLVYYQPTSVDQMDRLSFRPSLLTVPDSAYIKDILLLYSQTSTRDLRAGRWSRGGHV